MSHLFTSFRAIAKQFVLFSVCAAMLFGLAQPAAIAVNPRDAINVDEPMSAAELSEKRAERRAQQSQASQAANTEIEADSLGEVFEDKLNLEEIAEDNVLTDGSRQMRTPDRDRQSK